VLNKAVLKVIPAPTTVLLAQVGSSALILWALGKSGILKVDAFTIATGKLFFWNAVAFMILLFTNAKALESANVEAVIVFRTLSIFVTAYGDFRLLQAQALNTEAIISLCMVVFGAIGYVLSDKGFIIKNMFWVFCYGCTNAAYPIVTKMVIRSNDTMTSWGRTYYNNLMTFMIFLPGMFVLGEHHTVADLDEKGLLTVTSVTLLIMSCIWGTGISFLGFLCLENVSATTFNVMGNANKMLTLVINSLLWSHHASIEANFCLAFSLVGAACYGEAKRRQGNAERARNEKATSLNDLEARGSSDPEARPQPSLSSSS